MVEAPVCVLIPTLNEVGTIGDVIDGFDEQGFDDVHVIDGGSDDGTPAIAAEHGATVRSQSGTGKGQAVREALGSLDGDVVVLVDGDGTYDPADAPGMLQPILEAEADHVIGNRFARMEPGAMTGLNRVGNRVINRIFTRIHGVEFVDILSGYRAFSLDSVRHFRLTADGFGIETEMAVECVKHDVPTAVVPISYRSRPADSEPNLRPLHDGGVILLTLYRLAKTTNPLFYFGSLGMLGGLASSAVGAYVVLEWVFRGITHEVLATLAAFGALVAFQLIMVGVLADVIISLHREQLRRL